MIDLIDVTAGYRNRPIIKNFSLRLERGNFVVLIGPNGAGKSTLLRVDGRPFADQPRNAPS